MIVRRFAGIFATLFVALTSGEVSFWRCYERVYGVFEYVDVES